MSYEVAGTGAAGVPRLRDIVSGRQTTYGGWCMVPSAFATEIVSAAGCDWLCLDLQHGLIDEAAMRLMIQAAGIRSTPVVVRVPWNEPGPIMRALDAGADGVIVPMVNTAGEARQAAAATRYPPHGIRSWGPLRSQMSQPGFDPALGNDQVVCLVMIETVEGHENLDAILDVPGVDGAFLGPNDLAISHSGSTEGAGSSARDLEMIEEIAQACAKRGLTAGTVAGGGEDAHRWEKLGYTFLGLSSDAALLSQGMTVELGLARDNRR
jgi:4-hydroxy-2-oxoheptanedioate aldolase